MSSRAMSRDLLDSLEISPFQSRWQREDHSTHLLGRDGNKDNVISSASRALGYAACRSALPLSTEGTKEPKGRKKSLDTFPCASLSRSYKDSSYNICSCCLFYTLWKCGRNILRYKLSEIQTDGDLGHFANLINFSLLVRLLFIFLQCTIVDVNRSII